MGNKSQSQVGLIIIEIILAMALFVLIASVSAALVIHSFSANRLGEEETKATLLASEGLEATRSIKNQGFSNLVNGVYDVEYSGGFWQFGPTPTPGGKYTRTITVSDVYRDEVGEIVETGGTLDPNTKKITSQVTWNFSPTRQNKVSLSTYFTFWEAPVCSWGEGGNLISSYNKVGNSDATDVFIKGDYAYLVSKDSFLTRPEFFIIDISDRENPTLKGSLNIWSDVNAVFVKDNFAYLATNNLFAEFIVVDISNPASPFIKAWETIFGWQNATDVFVEGDYAYLVTKKNSLWGGTEFNIFDISEPGDIEREGGLELSVDVNGVFVKGNHAYLATSDDSKELIVVNITNKSAPFEEGSYNTDSHADANGLFVEDSMVYLATAEDGGRPEFYILDASDLQNISLVGSFDVGNHVNGVFVEEEKAYLANHKPDEQFIILDISNPELPIKEAGVHLEASAFSVFVEDCVAFLATAKNDAELQIFEPN